jgi:hypothetical protein
LGKSRGGTPEGERALQGASRSREAAEDTDQRVSAFRFLFFFFLTVVAHSTDRDDAGPTAGVI